jgi:hypothetical protein
MIEVNFRSGPLAIALEQAGGSNQLPLVAALSNIKPPYSTRFGKLRYRIQRAAIVLWIIPYVWLSLIVVLSNVSSIHKWELAIACVMLMFLLLNLARSQIVIKHVFRHVLHIDQDQQPSFMYVLVFRNEWFSTTVSMLELLARHRSRQRAPWHAGWLQPPLSEKAGQPRVAVKHLSQRAAMIRFTGTRPEKSKAEEEDIDPDAPHESERKPTQTVATSSM